MPVPMLQRTSQRRLLTVALLLSASCGCGTFDAGSRTAAIHVPPQPSSPSPSPDASPPSAAAQQVGFDEQLVTAAPLLVHAFDEQDADQAEDTDTDVEPSLPAAVEPIAAPQPSQSAAYYVDLALQGHPRIRAARQRVAAETNRIPQVLALPDPMFTNVFWPIHDQALQTAGGRIAHQMSLSQAVPWPEKRRTQAAIVSREVQVAQAEVQRLEKEVAEAVRLAYYELWYASKATAILEESQNLVNDLIQVSEARYRSGGSQQDVLRAQLEADRLDDQLIQSAQQKRMAQADLAALIQQPLATDPEADEDLSQRDYPQKLEQLVALAEQCNPQLRGLSWELERDRQRQRLACLQRYPDLQVGVNYSIVDDDQNVLSPVANGHDNISFTVGTTLPIYRAKINAGIREAAHRTSSTSERLRAERDMLHGQIRRLLAQAEGLIEQRDVYQQRIIPRTEDTLKLSVADYRGERTDFTGLIETYRELLSYETQVARIDASLAGTVARLERAVGCGIEP